MAEAHTGENIRENTGEIISANIGENIRGNIGENIVSLHSDRSDATNPAVVFHVWSKSRLVKKAIAAKSLAQLKEQAAGISQLDLRGTVTVTYEKNGTEIDNEEVFTVIAAYHEPPVVVVLSEGEIWKPRTRRDDERPTQTELDGQCKERIIALKLELEREKNKGRELENQRIRDRQTVEESGPRVVTSRAEEHPHENTSDSERPSEDTREILVPHDQRRRKNQEMIENIGSAMAAIIVATIIVVANGWWCDGTISGKAICMILVSSFFFMLLESVKAMQDVRLPLARA